MEASFLTTKDMLQSSHSLLKPVFPIDKLPPTGTIFLGKKWRKWGKKEV